MSIFRFQYQEVTYIDPDSQGWGHRGTVLMGRMEAGSLRVGEQVEVPTSSGSWNRKVTTIANADFRTWGKSNEYISMAITGVDPIEILVYFGAQPPNRDIIFPGYLEGEVTES